MISLMLASSLPLPLTFSPLHCVVHSLFFPLCRRQDVSLSGRGRPGLSDVSVSSYPCPPDTHTHNAVKASVCAGRWPECILFTTVLNDSFHLTPGRPLASPHFGPSLPPSLPLIKFLPPVLPLCALLRPSPSWISVLQNSKEEALNQAFKGDHHVGENNIVQELTKAILGEVKRMTGNDVCCDCGAPSESQPMGWTDPFVMSQK